MTDETPTPEDFARAEQLLPGLEPPTAGESRLQLATRRTLVAFEGAGLLDERHAMLAQLLLDLAEVHDDGRRKGRASAAAMAAAQMLAAYQLLIPETSEGGDSDDGWGDLAEQLRQTQQEVVAELRRGSAAPRDQA